MNHSRDLLKLLWGCLQFCDFNLFVDSKLYFHFPNLKEFSNQNIGCPNIIGLTNRFSKISLNYFLIEGCG